MSQKKENSSENPLQCPYDISFNEQFRNYISKEKRNALKDTDKFWYAKLFNTKVDIKLTLGQIFYIIQKFSETEVNIFNFQLPEEELSKNSIVGSLMTELDNNLNSPESVQKLWQDKIKSAVYDFTDKEIESIAEEGEW